MPPSRPRRDSAARSRTPSCARWPIEVERKSRILAVAATLAVLAGQLTWAVGDGSSAPTANIHPTETLSDTSERLVEVTVTAHRAKLTPRVTKFVNQIAARGNEEGLPRWQKPVCPFVSGLPRPDAEFILARVSEIAREAGVPAGGGRRYEQLGPGFPEISLRNRSDIDAAAQSDGAPNGARNRTLTYCMASAATAWAARAKRLTKAASTAPSATNPSDRHSSRALPIRRSCARSNAGSRPMLNCRADCPTAGSTL